jgi:hypothetical protein
MACDCDADCQEQAGYEDYVCINGSYGLNGPQGVGVVCGQVSSIVTACANPSSYCTAD